MADGQGSDRDNPREGFSAWMGVLDAFRDAVEETIGEMRDRSEVGPERAREVVRETMRRAQEAFDEARDRLDPPTRREFEALRAEVAELRRRLDEHSGHGPGGHGAGAHGGPPTPPPPPGPGPEPAGPHIPVDEG